MGDGRTRGRFSRDAAAFCRDRDIAFTVAIFPLFYRLDDYPFEEIHRRLGEFAAGEGIDWIDLLPSQGRAGYWVHPRPPQDPRAPGSGGIPLQRRGFVGPRFGLGLRQAIAYLAPEHRLSTKEDRTL